MDRSVAEARGPAALPKAIRWFDAIRERAPVFREAGTASWFLTRYDDVAALLTDSRLSARPPAGSMAAAPRAEHGGLDAVVEKWPAFTDPPHHSVLRRLLHPVFQPDRVEAAAEAVGAALRGGPAVESPRRLRDAVGAGLIGLLGAEPADYGSLSRWADAILAPMSGRRDTGWQVDEALAAYAALGGYVERAVAERRGRLGATLAEALREGVIDEGDAVAVYAQILTGAIEPTLSVLMYAVERIRADPVLWEGFSSDAGAFAEEMIRLASPFHFAVRFASEAISVRERTIPSGDRVVLVLLAANRDPRRFPEPERVRLDRAGAFHLSFGRGRHACIGAPLARRTVAVALRAAGIDAVRGLRLPPGGWEIAPGMRRWLLSAPAGP